MKISLRRVKCCAECGALVEPDMKARHEIWHQSLFDSIEGLTNMAEVSVMRQKQSTWRGPEE